MLSSWDNSRRMFNALTEEDFVNTTAYTRAFKLFRATSENFVKNSSKFINVCAHPVFIYMTLSYMSARFEVWCLEFCRREKKKISRYDVPKFVLRLLLWKLLKKMCGSCRRHPSLPGGLKSVRLNAEKPKQLKLLMYFRLFQSWSGEVMPESNFR